MGEIALRKWVAARVLHEQWGAPFSLLQDVMDLAEETVTARATRENWTVSQSMAGLHIQMIKVFQKQMDRFQDTENTVDEEKRARALSIMAKTLESIETVGSKLTQNSGDHLNQKTGRPDEQNPDVDATRREELDRTLAKLIEGLA